MAKKAHQAAPEAGSDFEKGQGPATRTEKDSMGPMEVPIDAKWGASTQRAVLNFPVSGIRMPAEFVRSLGLVKWAAAQANKELKVLDGEVAEAVSEAALSIYQGEHADEFPVDVFQTGSGTSTNTNANEVIAHLASQILGRDVHPNDHVNFGQSSNDVIPTTMHVAAVLQCELELIPALEHLHACLAGKAREFDAIVKVGRTHLQDAVPIRLGQEFSGYARQIELGAARVESALVRVAELPLGGTAVGTGLNAPEGMTEGVIADLRERTGLHDLREAEDHFEAQGARDALVELSGALKVIAASLTKIANDLRWMASGPRTGIMEIRLPEIQPGSSIMPAKVNPVIPESVTQVAAQVIGNDAAVTIGGMNGAFELNVYIPMMARNVLESIALLGATCRNFVDACIDGIEANEARATELVEKNLSAVTALVPAVGYDLSAAMAKRALKEDRPLREVVKEDSGLSEEEVDRILDMKKMTEGGVL